MKGAILYKHTKEPKFTFNNVRSLLAKEVNLFRQKRLTSFSKRG